MPVPYRKLCPLGCSLVLASCVVLGAHAQNLTRGGAARLYLIGLAPFLDWAGPTSMHIIDIALKHVNEDLNILPDYELSVLWEDTQCNEGLGSYNFLSSVFTSPTKVMVIGGLCSSVCVTIADVAPYYNLLILSTEAAAPALSDTMRFPMFFRMWPPETSRNPLIIDLLKLFHWRKVAIITELNVLFATTTEHLIGLLEENNVTLLTSEIFQNDPAKPVRALKAVDARIIVGNFQVSPARRIMCEAYKQGMYGPTIVWHLIGWFDYSWWTVPDPLVTCSPEQLALVAEGAIYASASMESLTQDKVGVSGFTPNQIDAIVFAEKGADEFFGSFERLNFYDAMWAAALALNATEEKLRERGKNLSEFTYSDPEIGDIIKESMHELVFEGGLGIRQFDQNGDPKMSFNIKYQKNGESDLVGTYVYNSEGVATVQWASASMIQWIGGYVPSDSTRIVELPLYMNVNIFSTLVTLAAIGIGFSVFFLTFNIAFRNKRVIKMSSPNMNNMILVGCMCVFATVFFYEQDESLTQSFCMIRVFTLTIGFSLVFGSLFSKTWRVHLIFASKSGKSVAIRDQQLFLIVFFIVAVNSLILIVWVTIDPVTTSFTTTTHKLLDSSEDVMIRHRVSVCRSVHNSIFTGILYVIQGSILAFGSFLAWETKKVTVEALNDSQLIGTCIYNVLILSALGVGLDFVLSQETHLVYALNATFMILGTFLTQCIIFFPKVASVLRGQADITPTTMNTNTTSTGAAK